MGVLLIRVRLRLVGCLGNRKSIGFNEGEAQRDRGYLAQELPARARLEARRKKISTE